MTYASLDDLIERAGKAEILKIADRDKDGIPDPDVIDAALQDARNEIDGYVGAKYALPLASVPKLVTTWAVSIARYYLHRYGGPDHVVKDYERAFAALKDVSRGLISLPVDVHESAPVSQTGQSLSASPPQVFTPEKLRGW